MILCRSVSMFICAGIWCSVMDAAERPNVLFISIDDLRNDLGVLGVEHARTPHLDRFARSARLFNRHYVQVPTCGASRCALMRGKYPEVAAQVGNNGIKQTQQNWREQSLPAIFKQQGYRTLALGKITHYPGGLTGRKWDEGPEELPDVWERCWIPTSPWPHAQAIMHGYANGVPREPGVSPPWEAFDGPDEAYPDAWVAREAVATLQELTQQSQPWFFAVGFFKPHLPFAAPLKYHEIHAGGVADPDPLGAGKPQWPSGWHASGEFRGNYGHQRQDPDQQADYAQRLRQAYAASISYMDAQLGQVLQAFEASSQVKDTVVVIWSDHGFLLGEHAIWGKHCLYEQALKCPLMIRTPDMPDPGRQSSAIVETVDLLPTLTDLCHIPIKHAVEGKSLRPYLDQPDAATSKPAFSFWTGGKRTVRTDRWRLIVHPQRGDDSAQYELFDYEIDPHETHNHADENSAVVRELLTLLNAAPQPTRIERSPAQTIDR